MLYEYRGVDMWITKLSLTPISFFCLYRVALGLKQNFPIFNWPLHELATVYETMGGVTQNASQPGLNYGDPLYNNINTLSLDGTNFVDINVGTHNFDDKDDYTFTFYMKRKIDNNNLCLLDYQSNVGSSGLTSMRIVISDGDMVISRTLVGGVTEQFTFDEIVDNEQWQLFSVALDNSQGKISVNVLGDGKSEISGWQKQQLFNTPGSLRLGGCFDTALPKFIGSITCLSLFDKKLGDPDLNKVDDACQESTFICHAPTPELTAVLNSQTCPSTSSTTPSPQQPPRYFNTARYIGNKITVLNYLMTEDLVPDPNLRAFVAMYPDCSIFQCGSRCMMDDTCKSFSLEEISEGLGTCRIYDASFNTGLVVLLESAYYARN